MSRSTSVNEIRRPRGTTAQTFAAMALGLVASASLSACLDFSPFGCDQDTQCDAKDLGVCQPNGFCSYPDIACPGTGYRFEDNAGDGLGGQCVSPEVAGTGTGGTTENDTEPPPETGDTTSEATTTVGPDTETDDGMTTGDECGGGGQACCPGNTCDAGLACNEGMCGCVSAVSVGDRHSCAIKLDGSVWCWGDNALGQLAAGAPEMSSTPLQVAGFGPAAQATSLASRTHSCAMQGGVVWCWGDNTAQKVDFGAPLPFITTPTPANWATPATHMGVGGSHTCVARGAELPVLCWGDNTSGQLSGVGGPDPQPATIGAGLEPVAVALGNAHSCVAALTGELFCWGANGFGQLGLDPAGTPSTSVPSLIPVPPIGSLVAGAEHTCASAGEQVLCWGRNDQGQLGDGSGAGTHIPTAVAFPPGIAAVSSIVAAADQTCAVLATGELYCWGGNGNGELLLDPDDMGNDAFALAPRLIDLGFQVQQLATGVTHTCALSTTGQLLCWGENGDGQIGDGTQTDALEPTPVDLSCP